MIDFQNADYVKLHPVDYERYADKVDQLLIDGEEPVAAFQTVRDGLVFTNMRLDIRSKVKQKTDWRLCAFIADLVIYFYHSFFQTNRSFMPVVVHCAIFPCYGIFSSIQNFYHCPPRGIMPII